MMAYKRYINGIWMIDKSSYYSTDGLSLSLLYCFNGFLSSPYLLRCEAQKLSHFCFEKTTVPIVDGSIVGQDLHTRDLIALW